MLFHVGHPVTAILEKAMEIALVCQDHMGAASRLAAVLWVNRLPFRARLETGLQGQQVSEHTWRVTTF